METKHTPGPWQIAQPTGAGTARFIWRNDEGPGSVGETNTNYRMVARDIHSEADAALIAAAVDLLATAKEMLAAIEAVAEEQLNLRKLESHLHELDRAEEKLRTAIAKAEGQA